MCGLFGFAAADGHLDRETFLDVAEAAALRGPHGYGVAWTTPDGATQTRRSRKPLGRAIRDGDLSEIPDDAVAVVGQARLVTYGKLDDLDGYGPLEHGGLALAHNGNARNHRQILASLGRAARTETDSEAIAAAASAACERGESLEDALRAAASLVLPRSPAAYLAVRDGNLAALADGQPLFVARFGLLGPLYACSRPFGAPQERRLRPGESVCVRRAREAARTRRERSVA